jgi:chaperone required for assembly of F1-ATPase
MPETSPPSSTSEPARKSSLPKRFYGQVTTKDEDRGRVSLLLDGKPVRTPGKAPFVLPNAALAEAVADEWRGQGARIDPATMPLTRLANSVIDGVKGHEDGVIGDILNYAGSDLICYRAEGPKGLVTRQTKHWDPIVSWAERDLGVPMRLAVGVMHVVQDPASLDAIGSHLASFDSWSLAGLHVMTGLSGSALLALATALGRLSPEEAWEAAHVDEDWQIAQWGQDEEAKERRANRRRDFAAAARLGQLLGTFAKPPS